MKIYHNPRCSKSRQTLALIQEQGLEVEIIEYLKETPTAEELRALLEKLGINPQDLIRKGEAEFKEHFKGRKLTDAQWIDAMVKYPKLIERPIVVEGDKAIIGRPPERVLDLLKNRG